MKAAYYEKPGSVRVLRLGEIPTPTPHPGEALIRVRACGLNRLDIWLRSRYADGISFPHIPGSDVAGTIERINGKSTLRVGQDVVVNPAIPCGSCPRCKKHLDCEAVDIFGADTPGGYAQYVVVPIVQVYPKPRHLSFVESAAFPLTFLTAWHMLKTRAALQKGETVFIWGASGALGTAAAVIANYIGANVIAAARSKEVAKQLRRIGAHETVIYTEQNVERTIKKLTQCVGIDVVFESVGAKTWNTSLSILRPLGRVVIAGTTSGDIGRQDLSDVYYRQLSILGSRMGTKKEFETILSLVAKKKLTPIVDSVFPLSDARKAQERLEVGAHVGKIVLEV